MASTYDLGVGVALVTILSCNQELCFLPPILSSRGCRSPFPGRKVTAGLGALGCGVGEVAPRGRRAWMTTPPPAGRAEAPGRALQGTPGGWTSLTVLRHWCHPEGGLAGAGFGVTTRGVNFSPLLGQEHPWWSSGSESTCYCRGYGFNPWSGKIPYAMEQISWCTTASESMALGPMSRNY